MEPGVDRYKPQSKVVWLFFTKVPAVWYRSLSFQDSANSDCVTSMKAARRRKKYVH